LTLVMKAIMWLWHRAMIHNPFVSWLKACGIEMVVMQSTGVYWMALYDILEARRFEVCLTNARHTKNLPGRKSDIQESQWLLNLQGGSPI
jgi:transposase